MSEADVNKKGLLSKELYKTTAHFVIAYNIVYKLTNIGLDKWWIRFPVSICSHIDDTPFTDTIAVFKTDTNLNVKIVRVASDANLIREKVKYYIKDKELYISFLASPAQPNNAFITSPYFHEIAGTPQEIIDDSFKEIIVKTVAEPRSVITHDEPVDNTKLRSNQRKNSL